MVMPNSSSKNSEKVRSEKLRTYPPCMSKASSQIRISECFKETIENSNLNPLHLVQGYVVGPAIVELGSACRGVVGHVAGFFERPAVLEIDRNSRGAEGVVADLRCDVGRRRAAADHRIGVGLGERRAGE